MKFGKRIAREELKHAPYAGRYVCYKRLKGIIKDLRERRVRSGSVSSEDEPAASVTAESVAAAQADPGWGAEFFRTLAEQADMVDGVFRQQTAVLGEKLGRLVAEVEAAVESGAPLTVEHPVVAEFGAVCAELNDLRSYVLLNYIAFFKIMKKFDKKCGEAQSHAVLATVRAHDFYRSDALARLLTQAECAAGLISGERPMPENYQCGICLNLLSSPVVLSCVHRFCYACLARASQFGSSCPMCRKEMPLDPRLYQVEPTLNRFVLRFFPESATAPRQPLSEAALARPPLLPSLDANDSGGESDSDGEESGSRSPAAGRGAEDAEMTDCAASPAGSVAAAGGTGSASAAAARSGQPHAHSQAQAQAPPPPSPHPVRINRLENILLHAHPGTLVALDIDETVVMSPSPSSLFSPRGVELFQELVRALPVPHEHKVELCQRFQAMLDHKVPVESSTIQVVHELQRRGCWVMGLTARYFSMAESTQSTLARLGLDLTIGQPAHLPLAEGLQDPETSAVFANGVIYTNATDKGVVLNRYLYHVAGIGQRPDVPVPRSIVFVDDRHSNAESVIAGLTLASQLRVPVHSYHYTGADAPYKRVDPVFDQMVTEQARHFFETSGGILTDEDACSRLAARNCHSDGHCVLH